LGYLTSWEDRFEPAADYRKIQALQCSKHYNRRLHLGKWVNEGAQYRLHLERHRIVTTARVQDWKAGFEWAGPSLTSHAEGRLSELSIIAKLRALQCSSSYTSKLATWVTNQRKSTGCTKKEGVKNDHRRIQELESMGFEWESAASMKSIDELADYRKSTGTAMF
jgi:hypothetical protein